MNTIKATIILTFMLAVSAGAQESPFIGMDINTIVENAGYPDASFTAPNGNKVYVWQESNTVQGSEFTYQTKSKNLGYTVPGQTMTYWCKVSMEVEEETVVNVEVEGNACQ